MLPGRRKERKERPSGRYSNPVSHTPSGKASDFSLIDSAPPSGPGSEHYFDQRGVYRVYAVSLDQAKWRYWRGAPAPDFSQRFTGTFSDDGDTIAGEGQLSRGGDTWEGDLDLNYHRVG